MMNGTTHNILLVEDDRNAGFLLKQRLTKEGYAVNLCVDGKQGLEKFNSKEFDLCILDIMLPGMDGLSLGKEIRAVDQEIPMIFLTARNLKPDKITGYETGCDDYITKPYDIDELMFKLKAMLRRTSASSEPETNELVAGKLKLFLDRRVLESAEDSASLSLKECELMRLFFSNLDQVVPRSVLLKEVWGNDDFFTSKSLDVYLVKIRRMLKMDPSLKLLNIHGFGYQLIDQAVG